MLQYLHLILSTLAGPSLIKSLAAMITPIPQLPTPIILSSTGTCAKILFGGMDDLDMIQEGGLVPL